MRHRLNCWLLCAAVLLASCGQPDATSRPQARLPQQATPAATVLPSAPPATLPVALSPPDQDPASLPPAPPTDSPVPQALLGLLPPATPEPYPDPDRLAYQAPAPTPFVTPTPNGPLLRDLWPAAPADQPRVTHLWLRTIGPDFGEQDTLWRVDLATFQKEQIGRLERSRYNTGFGQRSPNGRQIAYEAGDRGSLFLWPSTGEPEPLSWREIRSDAPNQLSYTWAPDGRRLVYINRFSRDRAYIDQLVIRDMQTLAPLRVLLESEDRLQPVGWRDTHHLLLIGYNHTSDVHQLLDMDVEGGTTTLVAEMGQGSMLHSVLAPDGRRLVFDEHGTFYLLDIQNGHVTPLNFEAKFVFWGIDSKMLFAVPYDTSSYQIQIVDVLKPENIWHINFVPPIQYDRSFYVTDVSPDGRFLIGCAYGGATQAKYNTWFYDIQQDRWTQLYQNRRCASAIDWEATR